MKTMIKKITLLLALFTFSIVIGQQAELSVSPTNGGVDTTTDSRTVTDWLHHDGENASALGNPNAIFTIKTQVKLTTTMLAPHAGRKIEELKYFVANTNLLTATYDLEIYTSLSGAPDYSETLNTADLVNGWNTIILATPYTITGTQELFVGYSVETTTGTYVNGIDAGPAVVGMNFYNFNNGGWSPLEGALNRNFNIRAGVGGATLTNDVGMLPITMEEIIVAGNVNITGTLINLGSDNLTAVDVNWQINGGTTYTETLTGLNLTTAQSYDFTHADSWTATPGSYALNIWVSNLNGNGDDENTSNDSQTKNIAVATQSTQNLPLYEEFTSSTCGPCAGFNANVFSSFMNAHPDDIAVIKYQMSWPSPGDPYYTAEAGVRRTFYGVSSVPSLLTGGTSTPTNSGGVNTAFTNETARAAFFNITSSFMLDGNSVVVTADVTPYISMDMTVHIAVVEKLTTGNVGNNGETSFKHVMMKMLPNAAGTATSFVAGTTVTLNETFDMSTTFVEEMNDLAVVVFVQDNTTKQVMQSSYSDAALNLGLNNTIFETVGMYPNPSNGVLNLTTDRALQINIVDVLGRSVLATNISTSKAIDVSSLNNGVYVVSISDGTQQGSQKLIIKK